MPRLPTMRVMGSHDISTSSWVCASGTRVSVSVDMALPLSVRCGRGSTGKEGHARDPPLGLLVHRLDGDPPQAPHGRAVHAARHGGHPRARRLVHERHELVGEAGHGATDADPADVGTTPDAVDPPPFRY